MKLTGAQILMKCLEREGVKHIFGYPGGVVLDIYDELTRHPQHQAYPGAPRTGRGPRRGRLCPGLRPGGGGPGDLGPRRHQHGDGHCLGLPGLHPHRGDHRPGAHRSDRQRRLSGGGHRGHHPALHQAQLPGEGRQGSGPDASTRPFISPAPGGRGRCWWTCPRM